MQALVGNPTPGQMPYTPAGGAHFQPQAPTSSSYMPPAAPQAAQVQGLGRGQDSQLVHMTSEEVNSLRGLAQRFGGDLSTNPDTGLTEMGWLGNLLPTLIGIGLNFIPGVGPLLSAGLVAAGQTALTGDLGKGLMAGLQAFGGASLAGALLPAATGAAGAAAGASAAGSSLGAGLPSLGAQGAAGAATGAVDAAAAHAAGVAEMAGAAGGAGAAAAPTVASAAAPVATQAAAQGAGGLTGGLTNTFKTGLQQFSNAAREGIPKTGILSKIGGMAPMLAGAGVLQSVSSAMQPGEYKVPEGDKKSDYAGPYTQAPRTSIFDKDYKGGDLTFGKTGGLPSLGGTPPAGGAGNALAPPPVISRAPLDSREKQYFDVVNPQPGVIPAGGAGTNETLQKALADYQNKSSVWKDPKWNFAEGGAMPAPVVNAPTMSMSGAAPNVISRGAFDSSERGPAAAPKPVAPAAPAYTPETVRNLIDAARGGTGLTAANGAVANPAPVVGPTPIPGVAPTPETISSNPNSSERVSVGNTTYAVPAASNPLAGTGQFVSGSRVPTANGMQSIPAQRLPVMTRRGAKGGGIVSLESGGHILPAFDVATYGNGSTDAGQKVLRKMGGRPIKGKGDGVSDSIKAKIDGQHEARVANGEVYFPPKAVAKLGGKAKLDAMMKAAQTARMRTRSGEKVRL